jgi:hypothetical protein
MNIAFWDNQLCERGTTIALYDYAYYNQTILGNKSFIFYDKNNVDNKEEIITKFKNEFTVHETDDFKEVDTFLLKYNITHIYIIKLYGIRHDNHISKIAKNCIHCIFIANQPHGEVYSVVAPWIKGNRKKHQVVPHMINLPENNSNMRELLNIPKNATVFGGYGGSTSFNISFVHNVVYNIALHHPNIYFLFANFNRFCPELPNIIHLPTIIDLDKKVEFINTTDAMLWARKEGETFGISIGEFSSKNKPVVAMNIGDITHVHLLGKKALWYTDSSSLSNILLNFNPEVEKNKDWNAYKEYTPQKVMEIFKNTYLT